MAKIAIDLHGGDFGPSVIIPSALQFFRENKQHTGVLIGDSRLCRPFFYQSPNNIEWIDADAIGDLVNKPSLLLRKDGYSSIEICYRALKNRDVDAVVSSEHTGVLLVLLSKYGKMHSMVSRPVLASWLPTLGKSTVMLDLGASFTASEQQLLSYAAVGLGILRNKVAKPTLALLNVGTEVFKGPSEIKNANEKLSQWEQINYQGFIEASEIFKGVLDVIVTDGFTGNSVIKASEGAMDLTFRTLQQALNKGVVSRLLAVWLKFQMKSALRPLNPSNANGALVAGSDLLVIKSHGNAKERAFAAALHRAAESHELGVITSITKELDKLFDDEASL